MPAGTSWALQPDPMGLDNSKSWTQAGPHSIEIRVLGTRGRPRVDLDAVVVVGDT